MTAPTTDEFLAEKAANWAAISRLTQHPLSAAFPAMLAEDFLTLKDDIEINGQREPIVIFDGMVLDGWHRYRACIELMLGPITQEIDAREDPVAFVKSRNLHRRHLTTSQRVAALVACSEWHPSHRSKKVEPGSTFVKTNEEIAKEAGTTIRTVTDAKTAMKAGLIESVRDGEMTVKQAANIARGKSESPVKKASAKKSTAPADGDPTATELAESEREAADELAALRQIVLADDNLAEALAEAKKLRALNRVLQERIDGLINEKGELVRRIKSLQRKLDQVGQPV
jgi:hypothetical protein